MAALMLTDEMAQWYREHAPQAANEVVRDEWHPYTVTSAILEARETFAKLRTIVRGNVEAQAEVADLEGYLADTLVSLLDEELPSYYDSTVRNNHELQDEVDSARNEVSELEDKLEEKEEEIDNLAQSLVKSDDEVKRQLGEAVCQRDAANKECERLQAQIDRLNARLDHQSKCMADTQKEAAEDREARRVAEHRMAAWGQDTTAAQTADYYREKYEAIVQELAGKRTAVRAAIDTHMPKDKRSKAANELYWSMRTQILAAL